MASVVLGIDLGTTNSAVAIVDGRGARAIAGEAGATLTPSVVSFHAAGRVLVGEAARARRLIDASNTVYSIKRLIGRPYYSTEVSLARERFPFQLVEGADGGTLIQARGETYALPEISGFVLRHLRELAEGYAGHSCVDAVITVPASCDDLQRTATRDAGRIAGLRVLRLLNEPTAAALAYGFAGAGHERIAVYDLGGGTFDLSILELTDGVFDVIATAGDSFLGGDDVDVVIAEQMAAQFLREHRIDLRQTPSSFDRLRVAAEWLKCQLSTEDRAQVTIEEIAPGVGGTALALDFELSRAQLERLSFSLIGRTFDVCERALKTAGLRPTQLDHVILVGGTTRIPLVRRMVGEYFGREPRADIDPDLVVAQGAAIQGRILSGRGIELDSSRSRLDLESRRPGAVCVASAPQRELGEPARASAAPLLLDVTPHTLAIETTGGYCEPVIGGNSPIPTEQTRIFSTSQDDQLEVRVRICQGESRRLEENQILGTLELLALRRGPRGTVRIGVTFVVDADGTLEVRAQDLLTGEAQALRLRLVGALDEAQVGQLRERQTAMWRGRGSA